MLVKHRCAGRPSRNPKALNMVHLGLEGQLRPRRKAERVRTLGLACHVDGGGYGVCQLHNFPMAIELGPSD